MKEPTFTPRQEKAIQHYLINGDKTAAYRESYDCSRMKPATINRTAKRLFDLPKICTRIVQERKDTYERNKATIDEVLSIASDKLRFDPADMFNDDGTLKKVKDMPYNCRMALSGIDVNELTINGDNIGETKKIKLDSRTHMIDVFMKHFGGYEPEKREVKHSGEIKGNKAIEITYSDLNED